VWASDVLNRLLDVSYHHLILSIPWQLRIVIGINRQAGLNLLVQAATEAIQQWARDVKKMRMGIMLVIHTFGSDIKWHPHIHVIVTGGGLSLDGKNWIETDPRFLMFHGGLKKRWKYQVITRMKQGHRQGLWRLPAAVSFLKPYRHFAAMLNKLWSLTWYAHIGASLIDPRFSVKYIGRYTKRAVLAEYRITYYDGRMIRFSFKDYAEGGKTSYLTMKVNAFIGRLIRHIPDKHFPMVRYAGLFSNRWKEHYLSQARVALEQCEPADSIPETALGSTAPTWAERQIEYTGINPLQCPKCKQPLTFLGTFFGPWEPLQDLFEGAGRDPSIPSALLRPG
jgi:hypothetical protein